MDRGKKSGQIGTVPGAMETGADRHRKTLLLVEGSDRFSPSAYSDTGKRCVGCQKMFWSLGRESKGSRSLQHRMIYDGEQEDSRSKAQGQCTSPKKTEKGS